MRFYSDHETKIIDKISDAMSTVSYEHSDFTLKRDKTNRMHNIILSSYRVFARSWWSESATLDSFKDLIDEVHGYADLMGPPLLDFFKK